MQYANDISFADTSEEFEWEQTSGGDKVKGKGKEKANSLSAEDFEDSAELSDPSSALDSDDKESRSSKSGDEKNGDKEDERYDKVHEKLKRIDPYANWDNGEPLTAVEHAQIMRLSTYEQSREMNIRKRRQMEADLKSQFKALTDDMRQLKAKAPAPCKPKATPIVAQEPQRRSLRSRTAK
jgi:hypothetical protein